MTNSDVLDRIAALEADMAQMKRQVVTREMFDQLLTYLARMDASLSRIDGNVQRLTGSVEQLNARMDRVETNLVVLNERVDQIGNDIRRLAQEM